MLIRYAAGENPEKIDGVILFASYPVSKLPDTTPLLSVYGSEDKVLQKEAYENAKENFPEEYEEIVINGGNHAYFGNYGEQSGDGEATISQNQQQEDTVHAVMDFIDNHMKGCLKAGFIPLPIENHHVLAVGKLTEKNGEPPHNDPFDRILITQAKTENMILITHDNLLGGYDEPCVMKI